MAKGSVIVEPPYVTAVTTALAKRFPGAQVDHEMIRQGRYRFIVVSSQFDGVGHPERQQAVWDLMDQTVNKADLRKIGMIITISAEEVELAKGT